MKKQKQKSTESLITMIQRMPDGLSHYPNKDIPFDIKNSEVVKWLISQEECLTYMFGIVKSRGLIAFDQKSNTWKKAEIVKPVSRE